MPPAEPLIRPALASDADALFGLIDALAAFEKLDPPDAGAKGRLKQDLFGPRPRLQAFLAEWDGHAAGYTLVFETYSSFLALPTLYLEDLFVSPDYQGRGIGAALFKAMVREAHARGCGRMEWSVLDWNQHAVGFYERFGARRLQEWHYYRLTQEQIGEIVEKGEAVS